METFLKTTAFSLLCLTVVFCQSCAATKPPAKSITTPIEANQPKTATTIETSKPAEQSAVQIPQSSDIVAKIGDYSITSADLEKRIIDKLRPASDITDPTRPIKPQEVLMEMIAEKAMIIDARNRNLLEVGDIQARLKGFKNILLTNLLMATYTSGKITPADSEIDRKMKANPSLTKERAKAVLEKAKAAELADELFNDLYKKLHVRKVSENFSRAAQIHQRLLDEAAKSGGAKFIRLNQIEALPDEEKNLALVTFDGGEVTLRDLLGALHGIVPPARPTNLSTPAGIEQFLAPQMIRGPLFVAGAKFYGFERNQTLLNQVKQWEEETLYGQIVGQTVTGIKEPNNKEIVVYFKKHRKDFGTPMSLKIDQIWCKDCETAQKIKAELTAGKNFESLKQEYSLDKQSQPAQAFASTEKMFFADMWSGEPNTIVGPIKGLRQDQVNWRIVKILEKNRGKRPKYSEEMEPAIKERMWNEKRELILAAYRKQLLQKYSYQIYPEKIKNPLDIP